MSLGVEEWLGVNLDSLASEAGPNPLPRIKSGSSGSWWQLKMTRWSSNLSCLVRDGGGEREQSNWGIKNGGCDRCHSVPSYWRLTYRRRKGKRLAPFHHSLADFVRSQWVCLDSLSAALPAALPALMHSDCGAGELCFSTALQTAAKSRWLCRCWCCGWCDLRWAMMQLSVQDWNSFPRGTRQWIPLLF